MGHLVCTLTPSLVHRCKVIADRVQIFFLIPDLACNKFSLTGEFESDGIFQYWIPRIPFLGELFSLQWFSRLWIFSTHVAKQATEALGAELWNARLKKKKKSCVLFKVEKYQNSKFWSDEKWCKMRSGVMRTETTGQSVELKKVQISAKFSGRFLWVCFPARTWLSLI